MSAWEYTALNPNGSRSRGVMEGDSARQVRQQLRDQGLIPCSVSEPRGSETKSRCGESPFGGLLAGTRRGIRSSDLAVVTRQLATLLASGTPLEQALHAAADQQERRGVTRILMSVRARVMEGHSLASALAEYPRSFPEIHVATVRAGEQSGRLAGVLERLADHLEAQRGVRDSVFLALAYPIVLAIVALLVVAGLLAYIVPEIVLVFDSMDVRLPLLTEWMIAISAFIRTWGWLLLGGMIALVIGLRLLLAQPVARQRIDAWTLRLPVAGALVRSTEAGRLARTLSILVRSGVPLVEALSIATRVVMNQPMHDAVRRVGAQVREGNSFHAMLVRTGRFPPMMLHLVGSGEQSGRLGEMLERAADQLERETRTRTALLAGLLEPAVIVVAGFAVMLIVLAVLLPIFELNRMVG